MNSNPYDKFNVTHQYIIIIMRSSKNLRLMTTDLKRIQKSIKEKTDKQVQSLTQLIDLPDFDISEFFQTLLKSSNYEQVLEKIPAEKQVQFFSRNYATFIETQDQLSQIKLPQLLEIPKAKQFKFQQPEQDIKLQDEDQQSVVQIVDNFAAAVLQKNNQQIMRILQIINQMKQHSRYKEYFNLYSINQLFRQSYETFLESCQSKQVLFSLGEFSVALKKYLKQRSSNFMNKTRTDMTIDNSARGIKKIMQKLNQFLEQTIKQAKIQFPTEKLSNPVEGDIIIPKFITQFTKQFYQTIEPCIYQREELSEIFEALEAILETSTQLESKGVNLSKDFRQLISSDLPIHMNKIIEVVIQAFDDILKEDDQLYEFRYFDNLSSLGQQVQLLLPIRQNEYGKKCTTKKAILLINSFIVILQPLCDEKWVFLQQNVFTELLEKVSGIFESNWVYWDCYQLFYFFDRLRNGKIRHKKMFKQGQTPTNLKQKLALVQKISLECWENFQTKITERLWNLILCKIPQKLWQIKDYIEAKETLQKPTIFSMDLVFCFDSFLKQFQFRIQKQQLQYLIARFYQYIIYVIEYVLYVEYHSKGTKQKVFSLYKKSQKIYKRAKNFPLEEVDLIKQQKKILKIGMFSKPGVKNFALDMYFFTEAFKVMTEYQKANCDQFVEKIAQIESKQHKNEAIGVGKDTFKKDIDSCVQVFKQQPQKIKQYMEKKKKQLLRSSK